MLGELSTLNEGNTPFPYANFFLLSLFVVLLPWRNLNFYFVKFSDFFVVISGFVSYVERKNVCKNSPVLSQDLVMCGVIQDISYGGKDPFYAVFLSRI